MDCKNKKDDLTVSGNLESARLYLDFHVNISDATTTSPPSSNCSATRLQFPHTKGSMPAAGCADFEDFCVEVVKPLFCVREVVGGLAFTTVDNLHSLWNPAVFSHLGTVKKCK